MSYTNEHLEKIIETSQALIEANDTNAAAQAALVEAQTAADAAQQDVDQLTALLDTLVSGPQNPEEPPETSKVKAVLGRK